MIYNTLLVEFFFSHYKEVQKRIISFSRFNLYVHILCTHSKLYGKDGIQSINHACNTIQLYNSGKVMKVDKLMKEDKFKLPDVVHTLCL